MPDALVDVPNPEIAEKREIIKRLRGHFSQHTLAGLLATARIKIQDGDVSIASARLGYVILRMIETPHIPLSPLEIICLGKYKTFEDPAKTPQGILLEIKDSSGKS